MNRQKDQERFTDPSGLFVSKVDPWFAHRRFWIMAAIVVVSVAVRAVYFVQINSTPCAGQHHWAESDMHFFDQWARDIVTGDWLTDHVRHPYHIWHQAVAEAYFGKHPQKRFELERAAETGAAAVVPGRALWNKWYGGKRFHQEPLYPYLIAVTYKIFGSDVRWVFAWQALVGVLTNVLICLIARRVFGDTVATVAGLLAVLCGPLLLYEMTLLRATLITFIGLLVVYLHPVAISRSHPAWWLATGLTLGIAMLLKTSLALLFMGVVAFLAYHHRHAWRPLFRAVVLLTAGAMLPLLPAVARNAAVGAPALSLSSVHAVLIIMCNADYVEPKNGKFIDADAIAEVMGKADAGSLSVAIETLRTHESFGSYLDQLGQKFFMLWHWFEYPNNVSFYYYRFFVGILDHLPVTFFILGPFSMVGLVLALPRLLRSGLHTTGVLYFLVVSNFGILMLAAPASRYRLPMVAALIPIAAFAMVQLARWIGCRKVWKVLATVMALILLFIWTNRPLPAAQPLIWPPYYLTLLQWHKDHSSRSDARQYLLSMLEIEPVPLIEQRINHELGLIEYKDKNYRPAADYYERVLSINVDESYLESTFVNLIAAYYQLSQYLRAMVVAQQGLERFPHSEQITRNANIVKQAIRNRSQGPMINQ